MPPEESNNNNNNLNPEMATAEADATKSTTTKDLNDLIFPMVKEKASAAGQQSAAATAVSDPEEIFNASIEFQQHSSQNAPAPRQSPAELRKSSGRESLYPSLDSLGISDDDTVDIERNWEAASRASMKKRASSSSKCEPLNIDQSEMKMGATFARPVSSSVPSLSSRVASMPAGSAAAAARSSATEFFIPVERNKRVDHDDMIAQKLAAYGGGRVTAAYSSTSVNKKNIANDQDMVAMKLAAYEGIYLTSSSSLADEQEQPAQATLVEDDAAHPSEITAHAVQADFIPPVARLGHPALHYNAAPAVTATEATVIESGPAEKATPEAWSAAPAAEATVLQDDGIHQEITDLDCKPPARDYRHHASVETAYGSTEAEHQAEATIIGYDAHPAELSMEAVQAEFIGQEDYRDNTAIGVSGTGSGTHMVAAEASEVTGSSLSATYQINGQEVVEEQVTEVDVIESGPMEKATAEAWSATTSGEAHVLEETGENHLTAFAAKAPLDHASNESWHSESHTESDAFAMMHGEAEVVGITEEVHPSELVNTASAQAELVGSAFDTAIAVPSNQLGQNAVNHHHHSGRLEHAEIIVESYEHDNEYPASTAAPQRQPQEAHATLLSTGECSEYDQRADDATPVTAILEPFSDSGRATSDPLPATPVAVLQEAPAVTTRVTFNEPVKPEPYSGRHVSEPTPTARVLSESSPSLEQTHLYSLDADEPEWTRVPSFGGDGGSALVPIPPPVATATEVIDGVSEPPPIPSPHPVGHDAASSRNRARSNASSASESSVPGLQLLSSNLARGANNVMETLFGNSIPCRRPLVGFNLDKMSGSVLPRTLLPSSVIFSEATNSWVATVNTNQKALEANNVEESSKALRAFSVPTKKQAMALARAWAPPQMHPFGSNPACFICEAQFAVFRRACHCRNCGVCVCGPCSVQWPAKMLPVTYNIKKESIVNICKACDWLCSEFRSALLQGDFDKAVALHSTGNINLTTPFANVKGELFYPVHCAVLGGNVTILKWLVDEHCCPLRSIRISNGKVRGSTGSYTPILTSKGRSLLGIALGNRNIGIVRYLVVEKRMLLSGEKGLSVETLAQNLDLVLRVLPEEVLGEQALYSLDRNSTRSSAGRTESTSGHSEPDVDISAISVAAELDDGANECIICCDNVINCVFTPCGHQICCLDCGNHISRCPVCAAECSPMRVFKP